MSKGKTFWTKDNPRYIGKVVSESPKANMSDTLNVNKDGYAKAVEVKVPQGEPVVNKVGGQRRMLASKKSKVSWW